MNYREIVEDRKMLQYSKIINELEDVSKNVQLALGLISSCAVRFGHPEEFTGEGCSFSKSSTLDINNHDSCIAQIFASAWCHGYDDDDDKDSDAFLLLGDNVRVKIEIYLFDKNGQELFMYVDDQKGTNESQRIEMMKSLIQLALKFK